MRTRVSKWNAIICAALAFAIGWGTRRVLAAGNAAGRAPSGVFAGRSNANLVTTDTAQTITGAKTINVANARAFYSGPASSSFTSSAQGLMGGANVLSSLSESDSGRFAALTGINEEHSNTATTTISGVYGASLSYGNGNGPYANGVCGEGIYAGTGTIPFLAGVTAATDNYAAGVVTRAIAFDATAPSNTGAGSITNAFGFYGSSPGAANASNAAGVAIEEQVAGTNATDLLLGSLTIPSGSWALYSSSSRTSLLSGPLRLNGLTAGGLVSAASSTGQLGLVTIGAGLSYSGSTLSFASTGTQGVYYSDGAGNVSVIAPSTSGKVLTSNGASAPTFQTAASTCNGWAQCECQTLIANLNLTSATATCLVEEFQNTANSGFTTSVGGSGAVTSINGIGRQVNSGGTGSSSAYEAHTTAPVEVAANTAAFGISCYAKLTTAVDGQTNAAVGLVDTGVTFSDKVQMGFDGASIGPACTSNSFFVTEFRSATGTTRCALSAVAPDTAWHTFRAWVGGTGGHNYGQVDTETAVPSGTADPVPAVATGLFTRVSNGTTATPRTLQVDACVVVKAKGT
ncbi:MAG: hypothetical protein JO156_07100 [Solirubrobacterales bacterium]|nr:hypothetical protein [Solirubrobacterales bacterium]